MGTKANREKIIAAMKGAGTYKEEFESPIMTLAKMMDDCTKAERAFRKSGGSYIVEYTNKAGAKNLVKNPHYALIENLRRDMLTYCAQLGLTPAGLKRIDSKMQITERKSELAKILEKLEE